MQELAEQARVLQQSLSTTVQETSTTIPQDVPSTAPEVPTTPQDYPADVEMAADECHDSSVVPTVEKVHSITWWTYPHTFSQSTLFGRHGSNSCTLIALYFGNLVCMEKPLLPVDADTVKAWTSFMEMSILRGNEMHDELFDFSAINLSCEEAVSLAGELCNVHSTGEPFSCIGNDFHVQMEDVLRCGAQLAKDSQNNIYFIVVIPDYSMLLILSPDGSVVLVDSHCHGDNGAIIAVSDPLQQNYFVQAFLRFVEASFNTKITYCNITQVNYVH